MSDCSGEQRDWPNPAAVIHPRHATVSPRGRTVSSPASGKWRWREDESGSCSSSSFGRDSGVSGGAWSDGDDEVESSCKGGPLNTMNALEDVLPIKKGISNFYSGKSNSFTNLAEASSSSSFEDLAKPDNPYNRTRKISH